jgi:hypothetical protein
MKMKLKMQLTTKIVTLVLGLTAIVSALGAFPWDWPPP